MILNSVHYYYDKESIELVREKEKLIIDKYQYKYQDN